MGCNSATTTDMMDLRTEVELLLEYMDWENIMPRPLKTTRVGNSSKI